MARNGKALEDIAHRVEVPFPLLLFLIGFVEPVKKGRLLLLDRLFFFVDGFRLVVDFHVGKRLHGVEPTGWRGIADHWQIAMITTSGKLL